MRYDVEFSDDDSRLLSYKSYDYYEPVTDPADCKVSTLYPHTQRLSIYR